MRATGGPDVKAALVKLGVASMGASVETVYEEPLHPDLPVQLWVGTSWSSRLDEPMGSGTQQSESVSMRCSLTTSGMDSKEESTALLNEHLAVFAAALRADHRLGKTVQRAWLSEISQPPQDDTASGFHSQLDFTITAQLFL